MLQQAYEQRAAEGSSDAGTGTDTDSGPDTDSDPGSLRRPRTKGPRLEDVELMAHRFLRRGTCSPFEWMLDLRSYGQHLAMQVTSSGKVN